MATRTFLDLVNRISPSVQGCPVPVISTFIRNAAIDVCERTGLWRYEHATVTMIAGTYEYAFVPEANAEVFSVVRASINGNPLEPITLKRLLELHPKYPSSVAAERATPQYITQVDPLSFHVGLVPINSTDTIEMFVTQRPTRGSTGMNEGVMDDLEDAIVHGALQHLLTLPDRTWSDNELAAYHAKQFIFRVTERRARAHIGAVGAPVSARFQSWA